MSALMSTLPVTAEGPEGCRSEQRPRLLLQADGSHDETQAKLGATGRKAAAHTYPKPYSRAHGDCLAQEPPFHRTWTLGKGKFHMVGHPHPKPWSASCCPGKKETPEGVNQYHRVWLMETGQRGRLNKQKKQQLYRTQDQTMQAGKPQDLTACSGTQCNKTWTHLAEGGLKAGGQEKMDYGYGGAGRNNNHYYIGKFENVKHNQRINVRAYKHPKTGEIIDVATDTRQKFFAGELPYNAFEHNKQRKQIDAAFRAAASSSWDTFRPSNTSSCPQLGADFVQRTA
eukprot:TRINITY_DN41243_c0_g1_i1.p2 TRINITY_DN41243_c0_g1~~TRINITY_DN41243_c0_g1_i1.p2  ORF type:complete len:302 (-),score=74.91 TRINITY_DN41243_c0_g1_i1:156-1007(-)